MSVDRTQLIASERWSRPIIRRIGVLVCASGLLGAAPHAPSPGVPSDPYLFGGRIIAADGGALDGVHVVATDSHGAHEAIVDSSGMFVGSLPGPPEHHVILRVFSDSTNPRYHTSVVALGSVLSQSTRIVLLPLRWRIRGGLFDGRDVAIEPGRATTRYGEGPGYWRVTRRAPAVGRAVSWVPDSFPIRLAFRHERGDPAIAPRDSVRFWEIAESVERALGRALFRPAAFAEIDSGSEGILVTVNRRLSAGGKTFVTYDQGGRIYEALVTVSDHDYLGESRIATHELLHAIGFGHTAAWSSVMGPYTTGVQTPTIEDVAYAQLFYAISELQSDRDAPFAILESGR